MYFNLEYYVDANSPGNLQTDVKAAETLNLKSLNREETIVETERENNGVRRLFANTRTFKN